MQLVPRGNIFVLLISVLLLTILTTGIILFLQKYTLGNASTSNDDLCNEFQNDNYQEFKCFEQSIYRIIDTQGLEAALAYTDKVIRKKSIFGYTHMLTHTIGHMAYHKTKDYQKAISYLPPPEEKWAGGYEIRFSGFRHGAMGALFSEYISEGSAHELTKIVCGEYFDIPEGTPQERSEGYTHCFHGVGHALMMAHQNDVARSLSSCEELPNARMRDWCYYGVFMENSYLFSEGYGKQRPRPDVTGDSMAPLCLSMAEKYRRHCSLFMGGAYLAAHRNDFKGVVNDCQRIGKSYEEDCIINAARLFVTSQLQNDFSKMITTCKEFVKKYEERCIYALSVGIASEGYSYSQKNQQTFCGLVEEKYREGCSNASLEWRLF